MAGAARCCSLALVPDDGEELYLTLDWGGPLEPWVERNVVPYLDMVPEPFVSPRLSRADAARTVAHYLAGDAEPLIIADWPEDIALFNALLVTGPGDDGRSPAAHLPFRPLRRLQHRRQQQGAAQRAARRARAARSHPRRWNRPYSAAVRSSRSKPRDRPRSGPAAELAAVVREHADLAHRLAVAAVGEDDVASCRNPIRSPHWRSASTTGSRPSPLGVSE